MGPAAHEAGAEVLQARQFDLQLALVAARALREDLEDEEGAVVDGDAEFALQVALLGGRQGLVEDHLARAVQLGEFADFLGFAAADEERRVGRLALADEAGDGREAGGLGEKAELFELGIEMGEAEIDADQNDGAFLAGNGFRQMRGSLIHDGRIDARRSVQGRLRRCRRRSRSPRS